MLIDNPISFEDFMAVVRNNVDRTGRSRASFTENTESWEWYWRAGFSPELAIDYIFTADEAIRAIIKADWGHWAFQQALSGMTDNENTCKQTVNVIKD